MMKGDPDDGQRRDGVVGIQMMEVQRDIAVAREKDVAHVEILENEGICATVDLARYTVHIEGRGTKDDLDEMTPITRYLAIETVESRGVRESQSLLLTENGPIVIAIVIAPYPAHRPTMNRRVQPGHLEGLVHPPRDVENIPVGLIARAPYPPPHFRTNNLNRTLHFPNPPPPHQVPTQLPKAPNSSNAKAAEKSTAAHST